MKEIINNLSVFQEGNKKNKPMLFIHGFPYDHTMWAKQIEKFSKNYFCVSYDIRGLGSSAAGNGQFTMESFVDDLEAIITELKLHKPIICGLSMGGYITLRALERMPDKFSAAILCDTKSESDDDAGKLKRAAGIKKISTEGLAAFAKDFIPNCFGNDYKLKAKNEFEKIIEKSSEFDPVGVKGSLLAMISRTDTTTGLGKINIPTLVICGEHDSLTPAAVMREMYSKINKAKFVEIKNAAHMTPIENSAAVNKTIESFINKKI